MESGVQECFARGLHLPQCGRRVHGYGQLPVPDPQAARQEAGNRKAELPDHAPNDGDPGAEHGLGQGYSGAPGAFAGRHHGPTNTILALPESVQEMIGSVYLMLAKGKEQKMAISNLPQNATRASAEVLVSC